MKTPDSLISRFELDKLKLLDNNNKINKSDFSETESDFLSEKTQKSVLLMKPPMAPKSGNMVDS